MPPGKISYLEVPVGRVDEAVKFYSTTFGWTVRPRGDPRLTAGDCRMRTVRG